MSNCVTLINLIEYRHDLISPLFSDVFQEVVMFVAIILMIFVCFIKITILPHFHHQHLFHSYSLNLNVLLYSKSHVHFRQYPLPYWLIFSSDWLAGHVRVISIPSPTSLIWYKPDLILNRWLIVTTRWFSVTDERVHIFCAIFITVRKLSPINALLSKLTASR